MACARARLSQATPLLPLLTATMAWHDMMVIILSAATFVMHCHSSPLSAVCHSPNECREAAVHPQLPTYPYPFFSDAVHGGSKR